MQKQYMSFSPEIPRLSKEEKCKIWICKTNSISRAKIKQFYPNAKKVNNPDKADYWLFNITSYGETGFIDYDNTLIWQKGKSVYEYIKENFHKLRRVCEVDLIDNPDLQGITRNEDLPGQIISLLNGTEDSVNLGIQLLFNYYDIEKDEKEVLYIMAKSEAYLWKFAKRRQNKPFFVKIRDQFPNIKFLRF